MDMVGLSSSRCVESSMPELLQEVAGRLVSVEEGLAALDNHKTALHNNSEMVKSEITSAVERQMKVLKSREKQLIRQVEVASTHQHCEVNMTQAQLLQHKGALAVTRTILDNCPTPPPITTDPGTTICSSSSHTASRCADSEGRSNDLVTTVCNTIATTVNCLPHQDVAGLLQHTEKLLRVPLVSAHSDEAPVTSAIQRWGCVTLPPSVSHSDLLPHCLEEYGDVEHHVLHKSVQPADQPTAPIDVRRPYLLAARAGMNTSGSSNGSGNLSPVEISTGGVSVQKIGCSPGGEDLLKWLHRMQLDTDDEPQRTVSCTRQGCGLVCVEEACQAIEMCGSFSECLMSGQCKKNAQEKVDQTTKWQNQKKLQAEIEYDQDAIPLQFDMEMSFTSRKRCHSESTPSDAARFVISHMNNILTSNNGTWLVRRPVPPFSNNNIDKQVRNNKRIMVDYKPCNLLSNSPNVINNCNKKQKLMQSPKNSALNSGILYNAPNNSWVLQAKVVLPTSTPIHNKVKSQEDSLPRVPHIHKDNKENCEGEKKAWLLPVTEEADIKKAHSEKENNLYRANMMKSMTSMGSIENLMEKIDIKTFDNNKFTGVPTDVEQKEWLLQQWSTYKQDNKILDEVMKKKSEWLSNSSLASFSIITDTDSVNSSWLLTNQL